MLADAGLIRTSDTGSRDTDTGTTAEVPFMLAAICVLPGATPVTMPSAVTTAIDGCSDDQNTRASPIILPLGVRNTE